MAAAVPQQPTAQSSQLLEKTVEQYLAREHIQELRQMNYNFRELLGEGGYGAVFRCQWRCVDNTTQAVSVKMLAAKVLLMKYSPHLRHRTPQEMEELQNFEEITLNYNVKGEQVQERVMWRKAGAEPIPPHMIENPMHAQQAQAIRKNVENIERELQAMVRANHPNVIKLENVIRFSDEYTTNPFMGSIVILAEEGDLFDYFDAKIHTEHETKQMMAQICCVVEHLYSRGIAHMDLKIENVLVVKNQHNNMVLKLTDFGISCLWNPTDTPVGTEYVGTRLYLCPQMIKQFQEVKQVHFNSEANEAKVNVYLLSDEESYLLFLELIAQNDKILKSWYYSEKLFNWQLYPGIWMWHSFVVIKSKHWFWSIEKNKTGIALQRSKLLSDVRDVCCGHKRNTPLTVRKVVDGVCVIKDVIDWLYFGNELNKEYRVSDCNFKDFAKGIEFFVKSMAHGICKRITGIVVSCVRFINSNVR